ncbi:MAG: hypothetical protein QNJ18_23550 [Xenococcaceae cyanobacterium MO_167.B52]|nr:hypothetical protein [Xenococcaceae cyanobacterium MO_167.B52]
MKKLITTLAFVGSLSPMAVAQEIGITLSDIDLTEIQNNICHVAIATISDETAIGNPLMTNDVGQYTYTQKELEYVPGDDDDDDDEGGYYREISVTVTIDSTEFDSTIQNNLSNPSGQEEVTSICV